MKSPLERAARALCEMAGNPPDATMDGKPLWQDYLPEVRAVISAIREPNGAILNALRDNAPVDGYEAEYVEEDAGPCWRALIDAILEEG